MNQHRHPLKRRRVRGFTLMEILLAMSVSAIVLSVISTVYFGALQLRNRTMESYDNALPLQHTLMVLKRDLTALMPPGGTLVGELQSQPTDDPAATAMSLVVGGQQVGPFLYTASGTIDEYTPFADVRRVAYFLATPTNGVARGWDLVRVSSGNLLPTAIDQPTSRWLMGGIESMQFLYFDGITWVNNWNSETDGGAPVAIKVQIVPGVAADEPNPYLQQPVEIVVPILMKSSQGDEADAEEGGDA